MRNKEIFTAPFGLLSMMIGFQVFLWIKLIDHTIIMERMKAEFGYGNYGSAYITQCIEEGIWILILVGECYMLWCIRKKSFNRIFAWLYMLSLGCVLVIVPCLGIYYGLPFFRVLKPDDSSIYWIFIGVANVCFIIMLLQAYFFNKKNIPTNPVNILDDYADKFN